MDYNAIRRKSRTVTAGRLRIGGDAPLSVQSMTNTDPHDFEKTLAQVRSLEAAGCDLVRLTVPDEEAAAVLARILEAGVSVPLAADIHFNYRLALRCAEIGVDKIRINPGNIGDDENVRQVANACRAKKIPIRIGVNGGSLEKHILARYGAPTPEALAASALYHASLLERYDFEDIVLSVKASDPRDMILANRLIAEQTDYPLHLGVTEAGTPGDGIVKSAVGIGSLLADGIGDTVRVSLTAPPELEVAEGRRLIRTMGIGGGIRVTSCPTCGRTKIDLIALCRAFEEKLASGAVKKQVCEMPLRVAIMGCVVNGPGEAREADLGVAGGAGEGLLFRHGEIIGRVPQEKIIDALIDELNRLA